MAQELVKFDSPEDILEARAKDLITEEQGMVIFRQMVKGKFDNERIVTMLDDLCKASDVSVDKLGNLLERPDWQARRDGLDRVLKIMRYMGIDEKGFKIDHPTKVTFNVINYQPKPSEQKG
jgi:hypothetical protein